MLLTIQETAKQLAVSESTVERLLDRGELHRVKIGRSTRIDADDVRAFVRRSAGEAVRRDPVAPRQLAAYHAKCGDIARLARRELRDVKAWAMEHASTEICGKRVTSSKDLSYVEMHDLLDWLEGQVERCRSADSAPTAESSS
jgi:excisionase family DNA binding protein